MEPDRTDYVLTPEGEGAFLKLGVDVARVRIERRVFSRPCPDFTERSPHSGGALGAVLLSALLAQHWVLRKRGSRTATVMPQATLHCTRSCRNRGPKKSNRSRAPRRRRLP